MFEIWIKSSITGQWNWLAIGCPTMEDAAKTISNEPAEFWDSVDEVRIIPESEQRPPNSCL